jgi:Mrp family chromosome partitioning ATPase
MLPDLPSAGTGQAVRALQDPRSLSGTQIRRLYDVLRGELRKWGGHRILLAAIQDSTESGIIGINLGLLAAANQSVLLIDTDLHQQTLKTLVSTQSQVGLVDIASGQKQLSEIIIHDPRTNINLLPFVGRMTGNYSKLKDDDIKSAFEQTKHFDLVIVLAGIKDGNPAAGFFSHLVDQIVIVAKEGTTRRRDIDRICASLGSEATKIKGAVLYGRA